MWAISHVKAMKIRWHSLVNDTNFDGNKQIRKKPFVIKHRKCIILIQANNKSTKNTRLFPLFSRLYLLMSSLNFALSSHNPPKSVQKCRFSFAFYFPINEHTVSRALTFSMGTPFSIVDSITHFTTIGVVPWVKTLQLPLNCEKQTIHKSYQLNSN